MGNEYNSVALAPIFNPHRVNVNATSSAAVTTKTAGANAQGFEEVIVDCQLNSGVLASAVWEVMYWSDASLAFVLGAPTEEITFSAPGQARIQVRSRRFYLRLKTLTGTNPVLSVFIAGTADHSGQ